MDLAYFIDNTKERGTCSTRRSQCRSDNEGVGNRYRTVSKYDV